MAEKPGRKPRKFTGVAFTIEPSAAQRAFLFNEYAEQYPANYSGDDKPTPLEFFQKAYSELMDETIGPKLVELKRAAAKAEIEESNAADTKRSEEQAVSDATKTRLREYLNETE